MYHLAADNGYKNEKKTSNPRAVPCKIITMSTSTTARKFLAFDIETAKELPGDFSLWRNHRPLGISCAATLLSDAEAPRLWHSRTSAGTPAGRMTAVDVQELVDYMLEMTAKGYTVLTWNGASFDFDVVAEESGVPAKCKDCVWGHVDMMFHIVCAKGFPVGLERAAQGLGLPGKPPGMEGSQAPQLWARGEHQKVLDYVSQDVRLALQIAVKCEEAKEFVWLTQKGSRGTMPLVGGWKTVREAMQLPLPDTSWMKTPMTRESFLEWMGR